MICIVKICLSASLNLAEGIESVEIVQVANVVSMATELDQNAVDVTISCQGRWVVTIINNTSYLEVTTVYPNYLSLENTIQVNCPPSIFSLISIVSEFCEVTL